MHPVYPIASTPVRTVLPPILLSLACAVAACWSAMRDPAQSILCNYVHPDCLSNHWLMVWVAEQVASGGSILHNGRYYWPVGDAPWLAGNGSEGLAYLPWHLLLGWPLASNVHLVFILTLNGVSAWCLARAAGASTAGSLAAAPTGALSVYVVQELGAGRFSQVSVCWLTFFLAAWLLFLDRPSTVRAFAAAMLLAATSLFYWYYGFFGVLAGATLLAVKRGVPLRMLALFSAMFLVLIGPLLWVFIRNWTEIPGTDEGVFPHPETANDSTWPSVPFLPTGGRHAGRALPFTTTVLAAIGLWRRDRVALALGGVALLFASLMAGSLIPHGPYEWIYGLAGPLRRFWWPYRHVVVLNLALVALAALGTETLVRRWRHAGWILALTVPLQLTLQRGAWHAQFTHAEVPNPFYREIAAAPGDILIEPPLAPQLASSQAHLLHQLDHRKTLLSGHALWVDRVRPPAWDAFVAGNSFLTAMQRLERAELDGTFRFEAKDLRALVDAGARTLVVNRAYFPLALQVVPETYGALFNGLFGAPIHTGNRCKAWDLARWDGREEITFTPFAWPPSMHFGGPTLPVQGMRAPSVSFYIPADDEGEPGKGTKRR